MEIDTIELKRLRKLVKGLNSQKLKDDTPISFEFIIMSLFPKIWDNIKEEMSKQYINGYNDGKKAKEENGD